MPITLIVQLLTTFGPNAITLVTNLINLYESNTTVTAAQWASLIASTQQTAKDKMTAQLQAANVDLTSPTAVALLALAGK